MPRLSLERKLVKSIVVRCGEIELFENFQICIGRLSLSRVREGGGGGKFSPKLKSPLHN